MAKRRGRIVGRAPSDTLRIALGFFARDHLSLLATIHVTQDGVVVRMVMQQRGWTKTGKKGSLGVRAPVAKGTRTPGVYHNTGGLAFWFLRAERYARSEGMPFRSVRERAQECEQQAAE